MSTRSRRVANRAISAATVAILGLTSVQVAAPDSTFLPTADAATRTVQGTTVTYDDQTPASVPWNTTVKQNVTRYGTLYLSLDAVAADGIARTGTYDQWGSPVPLTIWDPANQTIYRNGFTSAVRPDPFSNSNKITTQLGDWSYVSQSSTFQVTWNPAPGYIGYAPPLPIQIDPVKPGGQPAPQYDYATTGLPGKTTSPLASEGALGTTQTAQAKPGFQGVTDGIIWDYQPTYAFQVDRNDPIAALANLTDDQFATDADGNYVGYVTNELNTSEGRYTINPDSGEVTFTPNNDFFKTGDPTTKQATPIRVIVSNMTTNTDEGNGRVMAYGVTRPAHTINANNQSYSEVNTTYTPTVTKPSVQLEDVAGQNQVGRAVTLRPNYAQADGAPAINTATVELLNPDGTTAGKTLTMENEGTWQVNSNGTITFTPQVGFIGDPTPVQYTAKNTVGIQADSATLTVDYFVPDGRPATTYGTQGVTQKSTDRTTSEGDRGLTAQQMFPGYPTNWYSSFTYQLVDQDGNAIAPSTELKYDNVGTYTIDAASGEVTFTPDPFFVGPAPEVGVRIANLTTANGQQRGADGSYLPVVTSSNVYLQPAFANGNVGDTLKATPDYAIAGLPKIDTESILLIDDSGKRVGTTLTVDGQGTWTVDLATGEFSFTPVAGFLGNPAPVKYTARSVDGIAAREPSTVTVTYNPLVTRTATTIGGPTETQKSTDLNSPGDAGKTTAELFPGLPEAWFNAPVQFKLVDGTNLVDTLTVDGEGTYTIDPATGVVSFTPDAGFLGGEPSKQAGGVKIQAINTTANGTKVNSTLIAQYIPAVEDRTYTLPSATNSAPIGQPGKATPDYGTTIDPTSVQLLDAAGNPAGKELKVDGQGTWTVDSAGQFTFTPVPGFVGTPVSVLYTAAATNGGTVTGTGGVTITYPAAITVPATTVGPQGTAQNSTDKGANDTGRTPAEMFPNLPTEWYGQANSPVKFQLAGATDNVLTVEDVGTYTIDPVKGTVKFEPEKGFTGQAPAVEIQTVGLRDASGQPAEMTSTYQPFVVPVRVEIPSDYAKATRIGQPVEVTPEYLDTTVDKGTIRIIAPQGSTLSDDGKTLVVPGEGTWTVDKQGNFTFTPQGPDGEGGAFVGSPTPIDYTATNFDGIPAQVPGQISAFYPTPDPISAVTTNLQGVTQHSDDKNRQDQGLTAKELFPNIAQATWWDQAVFGLFAPDGTPAENNTLTVAGEGTYTINPTTGQVTFTPDPAFVGTAQSVGIGIVNAQGTPTAKYTAVVEPVDVHLYDASVLGNIGSPLKVTPRYLDTVDKSTVEFVGADGKPAGKELKVDGQGTWTVDNNGTFTFTPVDGFYGTPTPVNYTAKNTNGVQSTDTGTVAGDYRSPRTSPSVTTGEINQTQTSKTGAEMFPSFPSAWTVTYSLAGATENKIETDEGTFQIDPATGVVKFTPAKDFSGTPDPVTVQATTATGATETTTYQVSVTGKVTSTETTTATTTSNVLSTLTETTAAAPVTVTREVPTTIETTVPTTVETTTEKTVEVPTTVNGTPTTVTQTTAVPTTVVTQVPTTVVTTATVTEQATPVTTVVEVPTTVSGTPTTVTQTQVVHESPVTVTTEVPVEKPVVTTVNGTPTTITQTQSVPTTIVSNTTSTVVVTNLDLPNAEKVARTPGAVAVTPNYSDAVDRDSVRIVSKSGQEVTTLVVPGQGTWTVTNGTFTFTPEDGFTGDPAPIDYTASSKDGVKAHTTAAVTVGYNLPATETATATATERVTDVVTVTNPVETTTVTADPVTVTPPTVTVNPDPVVTTVTQVQEPQPVTVTPNPVTVAPDPVTTVVEIPGESAGVTTTLTISPGPKTITPDPVTSTIPGGTELVPVTVTPAPVTVTPDPVTVTPDPVTVTNNVTVTQTGEAGTQVEFTAGRARVDTIQGTTVKVVVQDANVDRQSLAFRPVEGGKLSDDRRTLTVPNQGTWRIEDDGTVTFVPEPGFTGELTEVKVDYTRTDGGKVDGPYTISGSFRPREEGTPPPAGTVTETVTEPAPAGPTEPTATATATQPGNAGSSGNETLERCVANAVRSPILWAIPIALLATVGGEVIKPYTGQFQAQIDAMNRQIQEQVRRNTPNIGIGGSDQDDPFREIRQQIDAVNRQFQQAAGQPEVQMAGKVIGGIVGIVALSAVLYDWCTADAGKAVTSIDFENGSSVQDKSSVTRYGAGSSQQ